MSVKVLGWKIYKICLVRHMLANFKAIEWELSNFRNALIKLGPWFLVMDLLTIYLIEVG